ncbi:MAG: hypothetical protein ACTSYA_06965, partial [Candidatus Kariarchaeaceae archaeon]
RIFNGETRELKGRISSIFVCQNREKPHKYACNIFQDATLFPPLEGSMRTGLIMMGDTQFDVTYCPLCEKEGKNLIPIQDFLHSELRSLLTQIKVQAEKSEDKREEERRDETHQEDIYDNFNDPDRNDDLQTKNQLDIEFSSKKSSLIAIPETDHSFQTKRESVSDSKSIAYDFDLWIRIIDSEREKEEIKLTLNQIMSRMIHLLAKLTHYSKNAFVPIPELIELRKETFSSSIEESLFWQKIFKELIKHRQKIPYLTFSNLLVNETYLSTLIKDLDVYCLNNLKAI